MQPTVKQVTSSPLITPKQRRYLSSELENMWYLQIPIIGSTDLRRQARGLSELLYDEGEDVQQKG